MNKLTPEIIESASDEQLSELVAVHCLGWVFVEEDCDPSGHVPFIIVGWNRPDEGITTDWQPHKPTSRGKVQAIELAQKYGISIDFHNGNQELNRIRNIWGKRFQGNWQIAVLKACLYSVIEMEQ